MVYTALDPKHKVFKPAIAVGVAGTELTLMVMLFELAGEPVTQLVILEDIIAVTTSLFVNVLLV